MSNEKGITFEELNNQISAVEGFDIQLVGFVSKDKWDEIKKAKYHPYPYSTPFTGPLNMLINQRIIPAVNNMIK